MPSCAMLWKQRHSSLKLFACAHPPNSSGFLALSSAKAAMIVSFWYPLDFCLSHHWRSCTLCSDDRSPSQNFYQPFRYWECQEFLVPSFQFYHYSLIVAPDCSGVVSTLPCFTSSNTSSKKSGLDISCVISSSTDFYPSLSGEC